MGTGLISSGSNNMRHDKKPAFTIFELLLAITLLVIMLLYLSSLFHVSYNTSSKITQEANSKKYEQRVIELLYADILEAADIIPTNQGSYDWLDLTGGFSLHGLDKPFVKWRVLQEGDDTYLVRAESDKNFQLHNMEDYYLETIATNVEKFKIVQDREFVEFYIKIKGKKPVHLKIFGGTWLK